MDILPRKQTTEQEVEELEKQAKTVAAEAELILKKANLSEKIRQDKEKIKDARKRINDAGGGYLSKIGLGGMGMSKGVKMVIIVVGTVVLFGLMKLAGC